LETSSRVTKCPVGPSDDSSVCLIRGCTFSKAKYQASSYSKLQSANIILGVDVGITKKIASLSFTLFFYDYFSDDSPFAK
jgi:hypothetical protein